MNKKEIESKKNNKSKSKMATLKNLKVGQKFKIISWTGQNLRLCCQSKSRIFTLLSNKIVNCYSYNSHEPPSFVASGLLVKGGKIMYLLSEDTKVKTHE